MLSSPGANFERSIGNSDDHRVHCAVPSPDVCTSRAPRIVGIRLEEDQVALVRVDNEGTSGFRSSPRWPAGRKLDIVVRLLGGKKLEEIPRR
jgi:hypothetical protein